jgi:four helix bundle protein
MKENIVKTKSFGFALLVVKTYQHLTTEKKEFVMAKQFLRSGTAVGALIRESEHAESKADFIHKLSISLKEANETEYWLDLLHQSGYLEMERFVSIKSEIESILRLLTSILKTSKLKK